MLTESLQRSASRPTGRKSSRVQEELRVAFAPAPDLPTVHAKFHSNVLILQALGRQQHNARAAPALHW